MSNGIKNYIDLKECQVPITINNVKERTSLGRNIRTMGGNPIIEPPSKYLEIEFVFNMKEYKNQISKIIQAHFTIVLDGISYPAHGQHDGYEGEDYCKVKCFTE